MMNRLPTGLELLLSLPGSAYLVASFFLTPLFLEYFLYTSMYLGVAILEGGEYDSILLSLVFLGQGIQVVIQTFDFGPYALHFSEFPSQR